ncbi:pleckstrin homology domain-containing family A member 5 isoform X4 [Takifugu rubripes]|uniref:pleckstrin homology domain-containing family A member 5 isoform X4 n=1 Tax=Takifugu rubripes TaxID=31033 RepID=UPI0011452F03|nr:pleckstrin homology domain-containing family A member 5-like isoform X4 [Takifugu rubripes]
MAADPQPDWLSCLPPSWSYGVTRDGRIFFLNEEAKSSTWLHPVTGEAVVTGHRKTPDLPTGWEEGYTFEGARCFINHNERKVTCKHPVSGVPSQDNCIFVVNEQPAPKASSEQGSNTDQKERPTSTMSEASNYTGGSDYSNFPGSPNPAVATTTTTTSTRPSRSSKKVHNFGKRSNSIKRNLNAPVVKSSWLYKQDSAGMKLWKKRWFVLSDLCLFYYRDEKEDNILGSILLPSFHISMLSVDDHISKKYAFKATHPNMRTYYFCADTAKEMEAWMKVMTDAALVHTEPAKRLDKFKVDQRRSHELNNLINHRVLTQPEIQNNERNREPLRQHSLSRVDDRRQKDSEKHNGQREREYYTLQRDGERFSLKKDGISYTVQRDGQRYLLHKDGEKYLMRKDGEKLVEKPLVQKEEDKLLVTQTEDKYAPCKDADKYLLTKDGEKYALQRVGERHTLLKEGQRYVPQKEVKRQLSLRETYNNVQVVDRYGTVKEVKKYSTLREGERYACLRDVEKYATVRGGFQRESDRTKISGIKLQPAQAAAIAAAVSAAHQGHASLNPLKATQVNCLGSVPGEQANDYSMVEVDTGSPGKSPNPVQEPERGLTRTSSMQQLENWVRTHRKGVDEDTKSSIASYQTLPRQMPSHHAPIVPRYPDGYRTLPRNSLMRPESICSVSGSVYDRVLRPSSTSNFTAAEKRRSLRDDTMWQLYEWQQRQAFSRHSLAPPAGGGHYGTLPSTKTMGNISEVAMAHSIPTSPSHGALALYSTFSPPRQQAALNPNSPHSEVSSPVFRADVTLDHLQKQYGCPPERRPASSSVPPQTITPQSLQGKTPEELTLMLIKLRRQQAELNSLREHTVAQLMALSLEGPNAKTDVLSHHLQRNLVYLDNQTGTEDYKDAQSPFDQRVEDVDIDTKLGRLCEQDKAVRMQEDKLQQLHREKHTLETALLSASQELSEQDGSSATAMQSLIQQRDVLQNGLLSTCRELSRVSTELDRSWREYDRLGAEVTLAKSNLLEQLEALGSPQTEPPSQRHIQIQKELWRIQDVMEALAKNKPQRSSDSSVPVPKPLSSLQKNEPVTLLPLSPVGEGNGVPPRPPLPQYYDSVERPPHHRVAPHRPEDRKAGPRNGAHSQAPDYRLYKSEPELTTVKEEVDEANNGEDREKTETSAESKEAVVSKGSVAASSEWRRHYSRNNPRLTIRISVCLSDSSWSERFPSVCPTAPPYPVGIVPPRTKSPIGSPESCTIASYVTLRKTRRSEPRSDRPRSALDQVGFGEREVGRTRMSVEEQLERMRRNQEASSLREKKREPPSRSASFNKDNPFILQTRLPADGGSGADPLELEAALQQLQLQEEKQPGGVKAEDEKVQQDGVKEPGGLQKQLCDSQTVVILDLAPKPQTVEFVNLQPFDDDESREQDLTSSATNTTDNSFQTPEAETLSPELREEDADGTFRDESLEQRLSAPSHRGDDKKHNNNNLLTSQTLTLVSGDT